jgi:hypothetical protein
MGDRPVVLQVVYVIRNSATVNVNPSAGGWPGPGQVDKSLNAISSEALSKLVPKIQVHINLSIQNNEFYMRFKHNFLY